MTSAETYLLNVLYLADVAERKGQLLGRDRLLLIGLKQAGISGLLAIADVCREKIVAHAPRHMLNQFENAATSLRSDAFECLVKQQERNCPSERAEQLAMNLGFDAELELTGFAGDIHALAQKLLQP